MKGPIATAWDSYRQRVLPANAGPVQVEETRRGFYAGAAAVFGSVVEQLSPGEEITEADVAILEAIQRELDEHIAAFKVAHGLKGEAS